MAGMKETSNTTYKTNGLPETTCKTCGNDFKFVRRSKIVPKVCPSCLIEKKTNKLRSDGQNKPNLAIKVTNPANISANKESVKKRLKKPNKTKSLKKVEKELDTSWSELVKLRAGNQCEICHKQTQLNSHHIFSRSKKSIRWDVKNGVCLCVGHHIGNVFSAHKTSFEFSMWLLSMKGKTFMDELAWKSGQTSHLSLFEKELLLNELKQEIKKIKLNLL